MDGINFNRRVHTGWGGCKKAESGRALILERSKNYIQALEIFYWVRMYRVDRRGEEERDEGLEGS